MRTLIQPENYSLHDQSSRLAISGFLQGNELYIDVKEFNEFVSAKKGLISIDFSKITEIPEGLIFPDSVKTISVKSDVNIKFPELAPECKNLEELDLSNCYSLEKLFPLSDFLNLKKLKISGSDSLKTIPSLSNCKKLESVEFSWCNELELNPEPLSDSINLKQFKINNCRKITETYKLPRSIEELYIVYCPNLTTLQPLSDFPELKTLTIANCRNLQAPLNGSQDCSNLQYFNFMDGKIKEFPEINRLNNLINLNLSECENLTTLPDLSSLTNLRMLNLSGCKNLTTLPDLSRLTNLETITLDRCENLTTFPDSSNLTNLKELWFSGCKNLTTLPDLSNLTNLEYLNLAGCKNLTTLPDLSNLTNLQRFYLSECDKLEFTPELIEKLSALEQTCSIIYPKHFQPSDLTQQCKDRLEKVIENFKTNNPHLPEIKDGIYELFERFLTAGIGERIHGGDDLRKKANKIAKSTEPFLDFIEKNPQHLPWINDASKGYIDGCVNQPVWGFFEISVLTQMAKEEKFSDKVILAKALFAIRGIVGIVAEENKKLLDERVEARVEVEEGVGISVEVEAGNVLLIELHKKIFEQEIIKEPWPGVPEKIAYQDIVINWCNKEHIKEQLNNLVEKIKSFNQEDCINYLCVTHYKDIWHQIAFPNNKDIENIITRHETEIGNLEDNDENYYQKFGEMGKTLDNKITDKLIQLTRAEIAKETNEINSQQPVSAQEKPGLENQIPDLQIQSEASSRLPISSDFFPTYEKGIIKFKIKSGSEEFDDNPAKSSFVGKFDYNKKLDDDEKYKESDYTKEKEQEKILALLKKASENSKVKFPDAVDDNFFIAVMKVASENRGIANFDNSKAFEEDLTKFNPHLDTSKYNLEEGAFNKIAKYFSAQFQSLSEKDEYLTAREGGGDEVNKTPRRLFRVSTEENIKAFQEMQIPTLKSLQPQGLEARPATSPGSPRLSEGLSRSASVASDMGSA